MIKLRLKLSPQPEERFPDTLWNYSFILNWLLTWLAVILSILLFFYPPAAQLNFTFLVFDALLFTLNNKLLIEKNYSRFAFTDYTGFGFGQLGAVIFYLKILPLLCFVIKHATTKFAQFTSHQITQSLLAIGTFMVLCLLNYYYPYSFLFQALLQLMFYMLVFINFRQMRFQHYYIYLAHPIVFFYVTNNFLRVAFILEHEFKSAFSYSTALTVLNMVALNAILIASKIFRFRPAQFRSSNRRQLIGYATESQPCSRCKRSSNDQLEPPCGHALDEDCLNQLLDAGLGCPRCGTSLPYALN